MAHIKRQSDTQKVLAVISVHMAMIQLLLVNPPILEHIVTEQWHFSHSGAVVQILAYDKDSLLFLDGQL